VAINLPSISTRIINSEDQLCVQFCPKLSVPLTAWDAPILSLPLVRMLLYSWSCCIMYVLLATECLLAVPIVSSGCYVMRLLCANNTT